MKGDELRNVRRLEPELTIDMRATLMFVLVSMMIEQGYTQKLLFSDIRKVWKHLKQKAQSND